MPFKIDMRKFAPKNFLTFTQFQHRIEAAVLDDTRGTISMDGADGVIGGADWSKYKGFYFDICANATHNGRFMMAFRRTGRGMEDAPDVTCVFGVLPGCTTRIWFDLAWLDGQAVHLPRTPGRLKMGISATTRFNIKDMGSFSLSVWNSPTSFNFTLGNFCLSAEMPEFPLSEHKLIDEMGQWIGKDWPGKTHSINELTRSLNNRYEQAASCKPTWGIEGWNKWGGVSAMKLAEGTGWFTTHHDGKRWWLLDPDGCAFISVGPDCVGGTNQWTPVAEMENFMSWVPGADDPEFSAARHYVTSYRAETTDHVNFLYANLIRAFGKDWLDKYAVIIKSEMMAMGFNTVANWSVPELYTKLRLPYFIPMPRYPTTEKTIFRSFPDVYSTEFSDKAAAYAKTLEQYKDDPCLVGYFMTNEPDWAFITDLNVAEQLLACPHDLDSKTALINWLASKYGQIGELNKAWGINWKNFDEARTPVREACKFSESARLDLREFTRILIRRYTEIPAQECRKIDPNHLNVGMRYSSISSPDVIEGWDLFDVYSINNYRMCPVEEINRIAQFIDRPIIIGEFHFGALDVGLPATGLRGVTTQYERGAAYAYYVENAVAHPSLVGAHFFVLEDQNALGRTDGENLNIGVMDVCLTVYEDFAAGIKLAHSHLYDVAGAKLMPTRRMADEIPMVFS